MIVINVRKVFGSVAGATSVSGSANANGEG